MNDTIETLGISAISGLPSSQQRFSGTVSPKRCRPLANADALKNHERANGFNLVFVVTRLGFLHFGLSSPFSIVGQIWFYSGW